MRTPQDAFRLRHHVPGGGLPLVSRWLRFRNLRTLRPHAVDKSRAGIGCAQESAGFLESQPTIALQPIQDVAMRAASPETALPIGPKHETVALVFVMKGTAPQERFATPAACRAEIGLHHQPQVILRFEVM